MTFCRLWLPKKAVTIETLHIVFTLVAVYDVPGLMKAASDVLTANWKELEETAVLKRLVDQFLKAVGTCVASEK